jgi:RHS repeat-associated protein
LKCDGSGLEQGSFRANCEQPDKNCEGQVGGPVNLATGAMWHRPEADVTLHNPFPFSIRRGYWSKLAERTPPRSSILSNGWGINIFESAKIIESAPDVDWAAIYRWDGSIDIFRAPKDSASWEAETGKRRDLSGVKASGVLTMIDEEGVSRVFKGQTVGQPWLITSIIPPAGSSQAVNICYAPGSDPNNGTCSCSGTPASTSLPCRIEPAAGWAIKLEYVNQGGWRLQSLKLWDTINQAPGAIIAAYGYDSSNRLSLVRGARYTYEGNTYYLSKVEGQVGSSWAMQESHVWKNILNATCTTTKDCRVTQTEVPGEKYTMTYNTGTQTYTTIVKDEYKTGTQTYTLTFNLPDNKLVGVSPAGGCKSGAVSGYSYNTSHALGLLPYAVQFADNSFTSLVVDNNGDIRKLVQGDDDDDASTIPATEAAWETIDYHPAFGTPKALTRPSLCGGPNARAYLIYDYDDPAGSPTPTFCGPGNCSATLAPADFNRQTFPLKQPQREIRIGWTNSINNTCGTQKAYVRTFEYDSSGRLTKIHGPVSDQLTEFEYYSDLDPLLSKRNRLQKIKVLSASPSTYLTWEITSYDELGNPKTIVDASLQTWDVTYVNERIATITQPGTGGNRTTTFSYGGDGELETVTLPQGNAVQYVYNSTTRLLTNIKRKTSPTGTVLECLEFTRGDTHNPARVTLESYYTGDCSGGTLMLKEGYAYGQDIKGLPTTATTYRESSSTGHNRSVLYDTMYRLWKLTDENHSQENLKYTYTRMGLLKLVERAQNNAYQNAQAFEYDLHGNLQSATDGMARTTAYGYDDFERVISTSGPMTVTYVYDDGDRVTSRVEKVFMGDRGICRPPSQCPTASNQTISFSYDLANRPTGKSGRDLSVTATYDDGDIYVFNCIGGIGTLLQRRAGRLASLDRETTTGNVTKLKFGYDELGRVLLEARQDEGKSCYHIIGRTYGANGQLTSMSYPSGRVVEYVFGGADVDRPTGIRMTPRGLAQRDVLTNVAFKWGMPSTWKDGANQTTDITRNYDGSELERKLTKADLSTGITWRVDSRDAMGNPTALLEKDGAVVLQSSSFSYDEFSQVAPTDYSYNAAGDRTRAPNLIANLVYAYTGWNLTTVSRPNSEFCFYPSSQVTNFAYTDGSRPAYKRTTSYPCDGPVFPAPTSTYTYYRYTVDGLHSMTEGSRSFTYDGLKRRASWSNISVVPNVTAYEFWSPDNRLLGEIGYYSTSGIGPRPIKEYIYLGNERVAVATGEWCDGVAIIGKCTVGQYIEGTTYYLQGNHLGATIQATNSTGTWVMRASYGTFGNKTLSGSGFDIGGLAFAPGLPGQSDAAGSDPLYNGQRSYLAGYGRYMQPESVLQVPGLVRDYAAAGMPLNAFQYAANNPLRYIDADGLKPGDYFPTAEEAARDALDYYKADSKKNHREYGGRLYKSVDFAHKDKPYVATPDNGQGTSSSCKIEACRNPLQGSPGKCAGDYHTHGAKSTTHKDEEFSGEDKDQNDKDNLPGFLLTPGGKYLKYSPAPGKPRGGTVSPF